MIKEKIEKTVLIGVLIIGIISSGLDFIMWSGYEGDGGFPVCSVISIFISYAYTIIILINYFVKQRGIKNNSKYLKIFIICIVPFLHIGAIIIGWLIFSFAFNFFKV